MRKYQNCGLSVPIPHPDILSFALHMVWAKLIQNVQPVHMPNSYRLLLLITTVYSQDSRKLDTFAGFFVCLGLMLYTVTEMLLLLISSLLMIGKLKIAYHINNQQRAQHFICCLLEKFF